MCVTHAHGSKYSSRNKTTSNSSELPGQSGRVLIFHNNHD